MGVRRQLRSLQEEVGELLERHEGSSGLGRFTKYADDPVGFAREELGFEPWEPHQRELLESVCDHPQTLVQGGNAVGKDAGTAVLGLWWTFCRQGLWLTTAATERQGQDVWMEEVARWWRRAQLPGELYRGSLRVPGMETGGIYVFTSTSAGKLSGFHDARVAALFSEAQEIEAFGWEGLMSCAAGPEDRIIATGNPLRPEGKFYEFAKSDDWHTIEIPVADHPNLREDAERTIPGGPSENFVDRMRESFGGENSPVYIARVLGQFPEGSTEGLFRRSWLEAAADRWEEDPPGDGEPIVAVDPARFGTDATVMAVRRGDRIEKLVSWSQADTMETTDRISDQLAELGVQPANRDGLRHVGSRRRERYKATGQVVVDSIGIGAGVADRLAEREYEVTEFKGSRSPKDEERFANLRAEGFWRLRDRLEAGEIALPRDEALFDELLAIRWEPTADGRVKIESKSEIRGRLGRSPDKADAVAMAVWPQARSRPGKVRVVHR